MPHHSLPLWCPLQDEQRAFIPSQQFLLQVSSLVQTPQLLHQKNHWGPVLLYPSSSKKHTVLPLWLTKCCISLFSKRKWCKIPTHSSFSHHSKLTSFSKYFNHLTTYTNPSHSRFKFIPRESNQKQMVVMTINYLSGRFLYSPIKLRKPSSTRPSSPGT